MKTRTKLALAGLTALGVGGLWFKSRLDELKQKPENFGLSYEDLALDEAARLISGGLERAINALDFIDNKLDKLAKSSKNLSLN